MITLKHATKIAAPRSAVYSALTHLEKMAAWHAGKVDGAIAVGEVMTLMPRPGQRFSWRTDTLEADTLIVQTAVEGPASSIGKTLIFRLSDLDDGRTLIELSHGEWDDNDSHLPFCNAHWGEVLHHLQSYVEKT